MYTKLKSFKYIVFFALFTNTQYSLFRSLAYSFSLILHTLVLYS